MLSLLLAPLLLITPTQDHLTVADIFSDHMVLQRGLPVPVWGSAPAGSDITVSFAGQTVSSKADRQGRWRIDLASLEGSPQPQTLTVEGRRKIVLQDVLVGEVWHASGQSNMGWTMKRSAEKLPAAKAILDAATFPAIRYRTTKTKDSAEPKIRIGDGRPWTRCTPGTAAHYSAVAFLFARRLHQTLNTPIGIIETAWGGKPIEPYIPIDAFTGHPVLEKERDLGRRQDFDGLKRLVGGVYARNHSWLPGTIYNSRIAPIVPYAIRGAIWYQAESNCGKSEDPRFYHEKMKALIRGWRKVWDRPELPVYFVQLPQYTSPGWTPMRDEQRRALSEPKTGMAVTIDLALDGIHPANKIDVADRLARWPLARDYGQDLAVSGPLYKHLKVKGDRVIVTFDHVGEGLAIGRKEDLKPTQFLSGSAVNGFEMVDASGTWHPADARIVSDTVVCSSGGVSQPLGIRYGWAPSMPPNKPWNLYNRAGLPASPFISDPKLAPYQPEPLPE